MVMYISRPIEMRKAEIYLLVDWVSKRITNTPVALSKLGTSNSGRNSILYLPIGLVGNQVFLLMPEVIAISDL